MGDDNLSNSGFPPNDATNEGSDVLGLGVVRLIGSDCSRSADNFSGREGEDESS